MLYLFFSQSYEEGYSTSYCRQLYTIKIPKEAENVTVSRRHMGYFICMSLINGLIDILLCYFRISNKLLSYITYIT